MSAVKLMGVHHAGVTVRNLDTSLAWYRDMFDVEPTVMVRGDELLREDIATAIGVPGARLSYAFLPIGNGLLELIEYHQPAGRDFDLGNNDVGAMHVGLRVDDVLTQYEHMKAKGAIFRHPPIVLEGELEGVVFAYASDPDGIQVELWQEP
jgi:catechol 2,3-dioxygenase-like lactoylglutathione lyase family enzyme